MNFKYYLAGLIVGSCLMIGGAHAEGNSIAITQPQIDNLGIQLGKPVLTGRIPLFSAPAKVVVPPAHEFVVSTSQSGLIVKMNAAMGDKVSKGELLAVINSPDLLTLQGNYLKAVGVLKLATATYNRDQKLRKEGVISGRSEQEAYSAYNTAAIEVNEARQLLKIAGMTSSDLKQLDHSGKLASQINVRSPITGRVIERMATTGSRVDSMMPLYRIANLDELWLEINIPPEHSDNLNIGDKVEVENGLAEATLKVLAQAVNPDNQTLPARAIVNGNAASLKVGQKVTVQVMQSGDQVTYNVPDSAIARQEGKAYIFIRTKDGFTAREIRVIGKHPEGSVIAGEINSVDEVAFNNVVTLKANWLGLGSGE